MSTTDFNASSRLQTKTVSLFDTVSLPEDCPSKSPRISLPRTLRSLTIGRNEKNEQAAEDSNGGSALLGFTVKNSVKS